MRWHSADLRFGLLIVMAVGGAVWFFTLGRVDTSYASFQGLRKGMSPDEVEATLGTPGEEYPAFHYVSIMLRPGHEAEDMQRWDDNNSWVDRRYAGSIFVFELEYFGRRGEERLTEVRRKQEVHPGFLLSFAAAAAVLLLLSIAELSRATRLRRKPLHPTA